MRLNRLACGALALLGLPITFSGVNQARAAFTLVDNFNNYAVNSDITSDGYTASATGVGIVKSETFGGVTSNVLQLYGAVNASAWVDKASAFSIAEGSTATLFFQYATTSSGQDAQVGAASSAGSFYERAGVEDKSADSGLQALDDSGTTFAVTTNTLNNVWVVINNMTSSNPDTYSLYAQVAGSNAALSTIATNVSFRSAGDGSNYNGFAGVLGNFNLSEYNNNSFAVDNVYIDTSGSDFANPAPEPASGAILLGASGLLLRRRGHRLKQRTTP